MSMYYTDLLLRQDINLFTNESTREEYFTKEEIDYLGEVIELFKEVRSQDEKDGLIQYFSLPKHIKFFKQVKNRDTGEITLYGCAVSVKEPLEFDIYEEGGETEENACWIIRPSVKKPIIKEMISPKLKEVLGRIGELRVIAWETKENCIEWYGISEEDYDFIGKVEVIDEISTGKYSNEIINIHLVDHNVYIQDVNAGDGEPLSRSICEAVKTIKLNPKQEINRN